MEWPDELCLKLIQLYEERPFLYDIKDKSYHNRVKRKLALEDIAKELGKSEIDTSKKWKYFRNQFTDELRRMSRNRGGMDSEDVYVSKWKFLPALHFLSDHVSVGKTTSNSTLQTAEPDIGLPNDTGSQLDGMTEMDQSITYVVNDFGEIMSDMNSPASYQASSDSSVERGRPASSAKKRKPSKSGCSDKSWAQLSNYLNYFTSRVAYMDNKVYKETKDVDDDELFGQMVASDLKKITNVRAKRRLRKKLSDVIYEALEQQELENETEEQE